MDDDVLEEELVCRMFLEKGTQITSDEQLALFMHRFNLDWDTVETMPAFQEHCKELFNKPIKKQ